MTTTQTTKTTALEMTLSDARRNLAESEKRYAWHKAHGTKTAELFGRSVVLDRAIVNRLAAMVARKADKDGVLG